MQTTLATSGPGSQKRQRLDSGSASDDSRDSQLQPTLLPQQLFADRVTTNGVINGAAIERAMAEKRLHLEARQQHIGALMADGDDDQAALGVPELEALLTARGPGGKLLLAAGSPLRAAGGPLRALVNAPQDGTALQTHLTWIATVEAAVTGPSPSRFAAMKREVTEEMDGLKRTLRGQLQTELDRGDAVLQGASAALVQPLLDLVDFE